MSASSPRFRRDKHLYVTETAKTAWSSGRTWIPHDSRPQRPSNGSCERLSKNGVHGSVYGAHFTPVQEAEVLVVPMRAYDLVLGLPWFQSRNPDVHWQSG